jgi:hypothetical protein
MATLYEITEDVTALRDLLEEITTDENGDPRDPTEQEKQLLIGIADEIKEAFTIKAESICKYYFNLKADIEMYKTEEKRLSRHRKSAEKKSESLKWLLEYFMLKTKTKKTEAGLWTLRMQKNPPSLWIKNKDLIPDDYKKIEVSIKGKELLQAIKDGFVTDAAEIQQFESLRIV